MVLKNQPGSPLTALAVAGLLEEAGVPAGVVNVVPTSQPGPVVAAMMADSGYGSCPHRVHRGGPILLRQAADTVLSCSMELGGNAPFIVFDNADLEVQGALIAKMRNGGEACTAANRFYVHEAVADEFTARLTDSVRQAHLGPGLEVTDVGPLVNEETRSKGQVSALVEGASTAAAGRPGPRYSMILYEPTVIGQVPPTARVAGTEIFGPVAPVVRFSTRSSSTGLTPPNTAWFYVYTRHLNRGLRSRGP